MFCNTPLIWRPRAIGDQNIPAYNLLVERSYAAQAADSTTGVLVDRKIMDRKMPDSLTDANEWNHTT